MLATNDKVPYESSLQNITTFEEAKKILTHYPKPLSFQSNILNPIQTAHTPRSDQITNFFQNKYNMQKINIQHKLTRMMCIVDQNRAKTENCGSRII